MMGNPNTSTTQESADVIRVMLVDDSAVIRGALAKILEPYKDIKIVASVANGQMAISAADEYQPHVVIMDIEMPVMDGITALPMVMEISPVSKVIMFSSLTEEGAAVTMQALALGAVECIVKPSSSEPIGEGSEFQRNMLEIIRGLAPAKPISPPKTSTAASAAAQAKPATSFPLRNDPLDFKGKPSLVMIGSSTGGPQALFEVIKSFKGFNIPIVITQHMPAKFTKMLAQHINEHTGLPSFEGENGMLVENGKVYVAPGGFHMHLAYNESRQVVLKLDDGPLINFCKPSVDPMFTSALEVYGNRALGVILTGMGNDGLGGAKALVEKGGRLIAQDEATSVVWGMPAAVAKAGLCSEVLPLEQIGPWVKKAVMG